MELGGRDRGRKHRWGLRCKGAEAEAAAAACAIEVAGAEVAAVPDVVALLHLKQIMGMGYDCSFSARTVVRATDSTLGAAATATATATATNTVTTAACVWRPWLLWHHYADVGRHTNMELVHG